MDKEKADIAARAKAHLAKTKAYQGYEKERAAKQRDMTKNFAAEMDKIKAVTESHRKKHLKIHSDWEKKLGTLH